MGRHYLYSHTREDTGKVFYIGIGTKNLKGKGITNIYNRAYSKNRSKFWKRIVNKTKYKIDILFESDDYNEIKEKEIKYIKEIGRRDRNEGSLCNLTDGGDGAIGVQCGEEKRRKLKEFNKKLYQEGKSHLCKSEHYLKLSEIMKGNTHAKGSKRTTEELAHLYKCRLEKISKRVIQEDKEGIFIKEWYTTLDVASYFGVTSKAIWKACSLYEKGATSCGFRWKFKEKEN